MTARHSPWYDVHRVTVPTCTLISLLLASCTRDASPRTDSSSPAVPASVANTVDSGPPAAVSRSDTSTAPDTVRFGPTGRPVLPAVFHGACEGEDCETKFDAVACNPVGLQALPYDTAHVVARVEVHDTVRITQRDLRVLQPGLVVLQRDYVIDSRNAGDGPRPRSDTIRFAKGDTAYLLRYHDLGEWDLAHRGRRYFADEFWAGPAWDIGVGIGGAMRNKDSSTAIALSQPTSADWWHVVPRRGAAGWWHADTIVGLASLNMLSKEGMTCEQLIRGP